MADKRPYGEERDGDVYPRICAEQCRLKQPNACGQKGRCSLECSPHRADRVAGAYWDNRRGVLHAMTPQNGCTATVTNYRAEGLPHNDPITIGLMSTKHPREMGGTPRYVVVAEGVQVDGPHELTLRSLMVRLDGHAKPRRKPGSSAANPSGRR